MAGFREFLTGEVLTAANVNSFLMKQSVMVFADASARTTALGAEVVEGMLTYNEDIAQLEVFDGSAFASVGGLVKQIVRATDATARSTTSNAFQDTFSVTITPSKNTNRLIILATFAWRADRTATAEAHQIRATITDNSNVSISGAQVTVFGINSAPVNARPSAMGVMIGEIVPGVTTAQTFKLRIASVSADTIARLLNDEVPAQLYAIEVAA